MTENNPDNRLAGIEAEASAQFMAVLDAAVDAIISIDQEGHILLFNRAAETMFGYSKQQIVGKNVSCLMPDKYAESHGQFLKKYVAHGQSKVIGVERKLTAKKADNAEFPIQLSLGEVKSDGLSRFIAIIRDISEQEHLKREAIETRNRQAHLARLSSLGEMTASIAHEINQPLSAISSYTQASKRLLAKTPMDQQRLSNTLEKIDAQAVRASDVINRLREFVKKRAGRRKHVDLNQLVLDTLDLAKFDTRIQDHEVKLQLCTDISPCILADPIQIQQVILNLIRNAIDAMEDMKGATLLVECEWTKPDTIQVSVIDHGHGVDASIVPDLYTPFFTTKEDGMGMGLSICQSILQAHGGNLSYTAHQPVGSKFSFSLPASELS